MRRSLCFNNQSISAKVEKCRNCKRCKGSRRCRSCRTRIQHLTDEERQYRTQITTIRYINPFKIYACGDIIIPTNIESLPRYKTLHYMNRISKITNDTFRGRLTLTLDPKYNSLDAVPWEFLTKNLKYSGSADLKELGDSIEKYMRIKEEYQKNTIFKHDFLQDLSSYPQLEDLELSLTVPQMVGIREIKYHNGQYSFPLSKIILNSPMQRICGLGLDANLSELLRTGLGDSAEFLSANDGIKFHQGLIENMFEFFEPKLQPERYCKNIGYVTPTGVVININETVRNVLGRGYMATIHAVYPNIESKTRTSPRLLLNNPKSDTSALLPEKEAHGVIEI